MRRVSVVLPALSIAGGVLLLAAPAADASCALETPRAKLASSDAAFVGRLVARSNGQHAFDVDESLKGGLPSRITVRDELFVASESLTGYPFARDTPVAVLLRRDAAGSYVANGCSVVADPAPLRAAVASGKTRCDAPSALPLTVRSRRGSRDVRLSARVSGGESGAVARIAWGDGRTTTVPLSPSGTARVTVRAEHRYRKVARYRIRLVVSAPVPIDCAGLYEAGGPVESPRTTPERVRTVRLRRAA